MIIFEQLRKEGDFVMQVVRLQKMPRDGIGVMELSIHSSKKLSRPGIIHCTLLHKGNVYFFTFLIPFLKFHKAG